MASDNLNGSRTASVAASVPRPWHTSHIWLAPLITGLLLLIVIFVAQHQFKEQDQPVRVDASLELSTLAAEYAEHTRLLLSLAEQFLLTVKWEVERHPSTVNLEQIQLHILLPFLSHIRISLSDSKGILYQSTSAMWVAADVTDISKRPYFRCAGLAMYDAKAAGKGTFRFYSV